ncbi:hypothetical protein SELMODRAFT_408282 [Selaginella moellendorffii]|uniref:DUF4042 domain-containing protein n=1 Tax=Selaginella moellendorffii TaxID=88036 RepID=D8R7T2_SELML|nr:hypothetical protein SELMODRAFT_408282 [Selaginella moellendorffii]
MAFPSARIRAWRSAFGGLRRGFDEAAAVQEILGQAPALARSSLEIPSQEALGDILALLDAASKFVSDNVALRKASILVVDLISSAQLEFRKESAAQVFSFLRGAIEQGVSSIQKAGLENHPCDHVFETVNALAFFVHGHGQHLSSDEANALVLGLVPLVASTRNSVRARKGGRFDSSIYTAIANVFTRAGSLVTKDTWQKVVQAFRKVLDQVGVELLEETAASRYYAAILRALHIVFSDAKAPLDDNIGGFVAVLRMFVSYGLPGNRTRAFPDATVPSPRSSQTAPQEVLKGKGSSLYRPPHLRSRMQDGGESSSPSLDSDKRTLFSDSEQSDNDNSQETDQFRSSKARTNAILCIQAIARADPKSLHAHWTLLLPTHNVLHPRLYQPTLVTTLIFDPVSKTRLAAASTISALLEGPAKAFLQVAEYKDSGKAGSFTTLSTSLGQIIVQLYTGLLHSVSNESQSGVLVAILKALSLLVSSSPFDRLPIGVLNDVINTVHKRIFELTPSSDQTLLVPGLSCLSVALAASSGSSQVLSSILEQNQVSKKSVLANLIYLARASPFSGVRIEALQALKAAVHSHSTLASLYWNELAEVVHEVIEHESATHITEVPFPVGNFRAVDEKTVYHSLKLLDELLRVLSGFNGADDMFDFPTTSPSPSLVPQPIKLLTATGRTVQNVPDKLDPAASQWLEVMNKFLPLVLYHGTPMGLQVRAAALTCFAGLTPGVYSNLSEKHQEYILSTVINAAIRDDTASVRSAASRAIGVLVGCSEIVERNQRLNSVVATIQAAISDAALSVRITSCWALANICDAFCKSFENGFPPIARDSKLLTTLAEVALKAAKDGDKVRANAVRALGNLAKFADFSDGVATDENRSPPLLWLGRMVQTLVSCITTGNVKVQWNVCHALGNLFLNRTISLPEMPWSSSVFSILLLLLRDSGNFKIRIHAASALAVPSCRDDFGESFGDVLHGLVHALESLDSGKTAPSSFKYMSTLSEQLDTTLLQILSYASPEDYCSLKDFLHKRAAFLHGWLHSLLRSPAPNLEGLERVSTKQTQALQAAQALGSLFSSGGDKTLQERFENLRVS